MSIRITSGMTMPGQILCISTIPVLTKMWVPDALPQSRSFSGATDKPLPYFSYSGTTTAKYTSPRQRVSPSAQWTPPQRISPFTSPKSIFPQEGPLLRQHQFGHPRTASQRARTLSSAADGIISSRPRVVPRRATKNGFLGPERVCMGLGRSKGNRCGTMDLTRRFRERDTRTFLRMAKDDGGLCCWA